MPTARPVVPQIAFRSALCLAGAAALMERTIESLSSDPPAEFLIYFTIQSNVMPVVCFALLVTERCGPGTAAHT